MRHIASWGCLHLKRILGTEWTIRQASQRMEPLELGCLPRLEMGLLMVLGHGWTMNKRTQPIRGRKIWKRDLSGAEEQSLTFPRKGVLQTAGSRPAAVGA